MSEQDERYYHNRDNDRYYHDRFAEEEKATRREVDDLDRRFNRLEDKLTELTDAVITIARVEEKISTVIDDTKEVKTMVNTHTTRIHELEKNETRNASNLKTISGIAYAVGGATVTAVMTLIINYYLSQ